MRRAVSYLIVTALLLSGCVSVQNPKNWQPQLSSVDKDYYQCLREAQQGYSSASITVTPYVGAGSAESKVKTNYGLLASCMKAQGYNKREATTTETVVAIATSPIWLPFVLLGWLGGADYAWQH